MTTTVKLPDPIPMVTSLTQALGKRRSHREFSAKPLSPDLLSTLLWSVAGISSETGLRTVPSAMDCREIVVFVFDQQGVWFYDAPNTSLIQTAEGDKRSETTLGQFFVAKAPVTLLFAADTTRCEKINKTRLERCLCVDTGCMTMAGQLAATALGLASVPRASFDPARLTPLLGSNGRFTPIMALTVGYPA